MEEGGKEDATVGAAKMVWEMERIYSWNNITGWKRERDEKRESDHDRRRETASFVNNNKKYPRGSSPVGRQLEGIVTQQTQPDHAKREPRPRQMLAQAPHSGPFQRIFSCRGGETLNPSQCCDPPKASPLHMLVWGGRQ